MTEDQINQLLQMPKTVQNPSTKLRTEGKHQRQDFRVVSTDNNHEFVLFTRQSLLIKDGFTAGLRWKSKTGEEIILVRCNGADHSHKNSLENISFDAGCHIHLATERYIAIGKKAEGFAELTSKYTTLAGALHYLTEIAHISGLRTEPEHPDLFSAQVPK